MRKLLRQPRTISFERLAREDSIEAAAIVDGLPRLLFWSIFLRGNRYSAQVPLVVLTITLSIGSAILLGLCLTWSGTMTAIAIYALVFASSTCATAALILYPPFDRQIDWEFWKKLHPRNDALKTIAEVSAELKAGELAAEHTPGHHFWRSPFRAAIDGNVFSHPIGLCQLLGVFLVERPSSSNPARLRGVPRFWETHPRTSPSQLRASVSRTRAAEEATRIEQRQQALHQQVETVAEFAPLIRRAYKSGSNIDTLKKEGTPEQVSKILQVAANVKRSKKRGKGAPGYGIQLAYILPRLMEFEHLCTCGVDEALAEIQSDIDQEAPVIEASHVKHALTHKHSHGLQALLLGLLEAIDRVD